VWSFGPDDLRDQYELFGLVLGKAAERAADRLSEDELDELRAVVAEMRTTAEPGRLARLNDQFHATINRASGSRRLAWLVRLLEGSVPPGFEAGGWQLAAQHHAQILERLAARDREGAGRAMRDHISAAGEHALRVLTESGFWGD
jgi:DNA-binding GntR family transcriptional regulator